ncbi:MAG TPA: phage holin family protein [Dermatophilaceae bacterium]|jgi:Putative Actinobacterial Holin-X, holin superfamily III
MTSPNDDALERTLGQLVADATRDISSIIHSEIALAKAEMSADAKKAGLGAGMFAVAGVFAFLALILLLIAAAYGLVAAGLAPWLAFLIVALVLLIIGAILVAVGKSTLDRLQGKPERAIKSTQDTIAAVRPGSS